MPESDSHPSAAGPLYAGDDQAWRGRILGPGESFAFCRRLTRAHAKSFYFASVALPAAKKDAAYAVYAFCRYADDLLDEARGGSETERSRMRDSLREVLRGLYDGSATGLPFEAAFRQTVRGYSIPPDYFFELIEGVCMDAGKVRIENFDELHLYCYRVASVVGLMMSRIFGLSDPAGEPRAVDMGVAMQLTNILRDVKEDLEMDRIYLPEVELARFDLGEEDLRRAEVTTAWREFMRFQIARAREYYARGREGIGLLAGDGSRQTVRIMSAVYAGILDEIERVDYNVFAGRVWVSFPRKLRLALGGCLAGS